MLKKLNDIEKQKIKNLCRNHTVTLEDVVELTQYHSVLIDNKDYKQAKAVEFTLYIIYQQASSFWLKARIALSLYGMKKRQKV